MTVMHKYRCAICDRVDVASYEHLSGQAVRAPNPPNGWRDVFGMMVCDRHRVVAELKVDRVSADIVGSIWRTVEL